MSYFFTLTYKFSSYRVLAICYPTHTKRAETDKTQSVSALIFNETDYFLS